MDGIKSVSCKLIKLIIILISFYSLSSRRFFVSFKYNHFLVYGNVDYLTNLIWNIFHCKSKKYCRYLMTFWIISCTQGSIFYNWFSSVAVCRSLTNIWFLISFYKMHCLFFFNLVNYILGKLWDISCYFHDLC